MVRRRVIRLDEGDEMGIEDLRSDDLDRRTLIDLSIESWRFAKLFSRVLSKLDANDASRYVSQVRYFVKKLEDSLDAVGLKFVNLEGEQYDAGMAVTALNIGDFEEQDQLVVDQMVEPVLMGQDGLVKAGTAMLRKVDTK